jgi:hypothetical protein
LTGGCEINIHKEEEKKRKKKEKEILAKRKHDTKQLHSSQALVSTIILLLCPSVS